MSKKCSNCGTPALDNASVFCNRCGARLPANVPVLICRQCNKTFTDPQSRFCNRCGSSLTLAAPVTAPAIPVAVPPAVKGTRCPACGFENPGEDVFYCKKCGGSLLKKAPVAQREPAGNVQRPLPSRGGIRIVPDGMDELRQRPVNEPAEQPAMSPGNQEPVPQTRMYEPAVQQEMPRKRRQDAPLKGAGRSYRRVAYAAAGVFLLVLVIAIATVIVPGMLNNSTADSASPGLFGGLMAGILPNETPIINQAMPVVTDTPLTMNVT